MSTELPIGYTVFTSPRDLQSVMTLLDSHGLNPQTEIANCAEINLSTITLTVTGLGTGVGLWKFLSAAIKMVRIRAKKRTENGWIEFEFNPAKEEEQKQILFKAGDLMLWIGDGEPPKKK